MEDFKSVLEKIENQIAFLEKNSKDLDQDVKQISDFFYFLETKYEKEFSDFTADVNKIYNNLQAKVYKYLRDQNIKYTLISELNKIYISKDNGEVIHFAILTNPIALLKIETSTPYVLKYYLSKNQKLEVLSLAAGLELI